ncbi:MAG TPA: shikimate kinase [Oscillospiraceae bacterium]|nr:shikimate kinase [Oscillospiraceae bacterium]HPF55159.1 shikimate kinase [Clostridiales bacterium]HPK34602.1 shikimate kinase [Oscillospiraceae bacterium]HPR75934.1 shikimate kinase [Oscillospiraceae bacterium]
MPNGIIVFGANGSGKSTLGRELARVLNYKFIDHEDYAFEKSEIPYTAERSREECLRLMLADINQYRSFVLCAVTGTFAMRLRRCTILPYICRHRRIFACSALSSVPLNGMVPRSGGRRHG